MENAPNDIAKVFAKLHLPEPSIVADCSQNVFKLSGTVGSNGQKAMAEEIARQIAGEATVINEIVVTARLETPSEAHLKTVIQHAFENHWLIPHQKIVVEVSGNAVDLTGLLHWKFQKNKALDVARQVQLELPVTDHLRVKAGVDNALKELAIEHTLSENWGLASDQIKVSVNDKTASLSGIVPSMAQKELAEHIAWQVDGVWNVENNLVVDY